MSLQLKKVSVFLFPQFRYYETFVELGPPPFKN